MADIEKECITCGGRGHTYLECPRAPFGSIFMAAFGVQAIGGPPLDALAAELTDIEAERRGEMPAHLAPDYWGA